jgi:hypothetical protein
MWVCDLVLILRSVYPENYSSCTPTRSRASRDSRAARVSGVTAVSRAMHAQSVTLLKMLSFEAVLTFFVLHATGARGIGAGDGAAIFFFTYLRRIAGTGVEWLQKASWHTQKI